MKTVRLNQLRSTLIAACILVILHLGCGGSKPARFYTLTPMADSGSEFSFTGEQPDIAIGVGPVEFPDYLMRPQIATQPGPNQIDYAEFDRWAEPLGDNFIRIIAENLVELIPTDQIAIFPWRASTPVQYQVTMEVLRFELQANKRVSLKVRWSILQYDQSKLLVRKLSDFHRDYQGVDNKMDYAALAAVMSALVEELSREIAGQIKNMSI